MKYFSYLFVSLVLMMSVGSAYAQDSARSLIRACYNDYQNYCYDVAPGGGNIASCLASQREDLSPRCRRALKKAQSVVRKLRSARRALASCAVDLERYCTGAAPGKGRKFSCLNRNMDRLQPVCRKEVRKARAKLSRN